MILTKYALEEKIKSSKYNPHAAYEVGEHYYAQEDYEKAIQWYQKAITGVNPDPLAYYALGYAFQTGQGTPVDLIQALHYYEMAAKKDLPQACYNLAYFYQNGIGVAKNQELSDRYIERASEYLTKQADELLAAKAGLLEVQNSYRKTLEEIGRKSDEWMQISRDCVFYEKERNACEAEISQYRDQVNQIQQTRDELQKELQTQKESYEILLKTHQEVLRMLDTQKDDYKRIKAEAEKCTELYRKEEEKVLSVKGENNQLVKEKEDLMLLVRQNQNQLLVCRGQLEEGKNKINSLTFNLESCRQYQVAADNQISKLKKEKKGILIWALLELMILIMLFSLIFIFVLL